MAILIEIEHSFIYLLLLLFRFKNNIIRGNYTSKQSSKKILRATKSKRFVRRRMIAVIHEAVLNQANPISSERISQLDHRKSTGLTKLLINKKFKKNFWNNKYSLNQISDNAININVCG